jgi:hypothetical protein
LKFFPSKEISIQLEPNYRGVEEKPIGKYILESGHDMHPTWVNLRECVHDECSLGRKPPQSVSFKQGLAAPLFCSISLFGFYALLRFFPNLDIRTFISGYLGVAGAVAVASNLAPPLRALLPKSDDLSWRIGMARHTIFA